MAQDSRDYWTAFALGAIVGVGATLLLSPDESRARKLLHEIEPALRRARRNVRGAARRGVKKTRKSLRYYR